MLSSCRSTVPSYFTVRDCPTGTGQQEVFRLLGSPIAIFKSKEKFLETLPVKYIPADWLQKNEDPEIVYREYYSRILEGDPGGHRYWLYGGTYGF